MWPGFDGFEAAALLALMGVIFLSGRDLATQALKSDISTISITGYAFAASAVAGVILILTGEPLEGPGVSQTGLFLFVTLLRVSPLVPLF